MTGADAIVLAGGRASRMSGADKPAIVVGVRSMLDTAVDAVAGCARVVVVGPPRPELDPTIVQVREEPPGSGPVTAIDTGLRALGPGEELVVVLAADLPFLAAATVRALIRHATETGADAVFAADASGRTQFLVGVWRRTALRTALDSLTSPVDQAMKAIVPSGAATITLPGVEDCDTDTHVRQARTAATVDGPALTLEHARNLLRVSLTRLPEHRGRLREVPGAALASPLIAAAPLPRFDVSAMDGYAVAGTGPWRLRADIGFAGGERAGALIEGAAVRIATGAQVPQGSTSVLRDEFGVVDEQLLRRIPNTPVREDIRRQGEDMCPGDRLAPRGTPVGAALVSAAAAVEVSDAVVRGPVRARIVVTGDEVRATGPLSGGQIRDSIGPVLPTILSWYGIHTIDQVSVGDTADGFDEILSATQEYDLLVVVGATGSGAADQLRAGVTRARARVLIPRLLMRPGGSTIVAELDSGTTILGLPGNPFAAVATLMALTPALVEGRTGAAAALPLRGPLRNGGQISGPVTRVVAARNAFDGGWFGDRHTRTAHLGGLLDHDGLVIVPANATDDTAVEFLPLRG
ncbi:NTP transferase domain-containing protein [Nocardia callitridis]|uniref:Molybdopterin molybdenumtransferase n=1 Tax=Nocardia callitridis TaxID=648753 RepID=A0ABP9JQR7_9NOCA